MKKLSDKAKMYARSYGQPPYGREIEGTAELLLRMAEKLEDYEDLQDKLDKQFEGCIDIEMFIDSIIEFDKQLSRDEKLAEAIMLTNDEVRKYREWRNLEEQWKLLKPPISPETPIYSIEYCCGKNKDNKSGICYKGFCKDCENRSYYILEATAESCCKICEIGKTVFFIEEEAKAALRELKRGREE